MLSTLVQIITENYLQINKLLTKSMVQADILKAVIFLYSLMLFEEGKALFYFGRYLPCEIQMNASGASEFSGHFQALLQTKETILRTIIRE